MLMLSEGQKRPETIQASQQTDLIETELKVSSLHSASKLPVELTGGCQDLPSASDSSGLCWTWKSTLKSVARPLVLTHGVLGLS